MRGTFALTLILCLLLGSFVACDSGEEKTEGTTDVMTEAQTVETDTGKETEETFVDIKTETDPVNDGETENSTETQTEKVTETETETEASYEAKLPGKKADLAYTSADGYVMSQYNSSTKADYHSACAYYENEGYSLYSSCEMGGLLTSVYVGEQDLGYATVGFNRDQNELYLGVSERGVALPEFDELGEKVCDVTVTQRHSSEVNGMTYVVRLTDGSFFVIDGGYKQEAESLYQLLCRLNGGEEGIHIRAWLISHSHGDHYQAFNQFSKDFASKVKLDYLLYSPVISAKQQDRYFNDTLNTDIGNFDGAELFGVHTGMSFDLGGLDLQILVSPEHIYKETAPDDFNETSVVCRIANDDGSMIFLADCGVNACNFMIDTYGDALKSDMVQVSHHGCETATAELYDKIAAHTVFWPCNESLFVSYRGELVKQHIIEAEYSKEHLLHGYGDVTRSLSYKAETPEYFSLIPKAVGVVKTNKNSTNVRLEDGVLKFDVTGEEEKLDPYIHYTLKNVSAEEYNAIRIVVNSEACKVSDLYYTAGNLQISAFSPNMCNKLGVTGASDDGKTTLIMYLADVENYFGKLTSIRLDFGSVSGETVSIYSIDAFYVEVDGK